MGESVSNHSVGWHAYIKTSESDIADDTRLINEHGVRNCSETKQVTKPILRVDSVGEHYMGLFNVRPGFFDALEIQSYGRNLNTSRSVLCVELLPDRQLTTASSPGSPHEQDVLSVRESGERMVSSLDSRQSEVNDLISYLQHIGHVLLHQPGTESSALDEA